MNNIKSLLIVAIMLLLLVAGYFAMWIIAILLAGYVMYHIISVFNDPTDY